MLRAAPRHDTRHNPPHNPETDAMSNPHVPGGFDHALTGVHPNVFRPPTSPSSPYLPPTGLPDPPQKRKRVDTEFTPVRDLGHRYVLAGQIETPGAEGELGESTYSDVAYRRRLAPGEAGGSEGLFGSVREGWGSAALGAIGGVVGGVVGRVWEFCKAGAFKGFYAGGGTAYSAEGKVVEEAPRGVSQRRPLDERSVADVSRFGMDSGDAGVDMPRFGVDPRRDPEADTPRFGADPRRDPGMDMGFGAAARTDTAMDAPRFGEDPGKDPVVDSRFGVHSTSDAVVPDFGVGPERDPAPDIPRFGADPRRDPAMDMPRPGADSRRESGIPRFGGDSRRNSGMDMRFGADSRRDSGIHTPRLSVGSRRESGIPRFTPDSRRDSGMDMGTSATPDSTSQPSAKRRHVGDELGRNWVMVDEPVRRPRPGAARSNTARRPRASEPSAGLGRRTTAPVSRPSTGLGTYAKTLVQPRRPHRVSHAGSPALSPKEPASFAGQRSPSAFAPMPARELFPASPSPSRIPLSNRMQHHRTASNLSPASTRPHTRTNSHADARPPSSSAPVGIPRNGTRGLESPRLDSEARELAARREREERDADEQFAAFNARLRDMIREGKEALGTRVDVEGEGDSWMDES